jgi:hypothetical protein
MNVVPDAPRSPASGLWNRHSTKSVCFDMRNSAQQQSRPVPTTETPQDVQRDLGFKRLEIRDQLKELRSRRNELLEQRAVVNEPQRKLLDERIANIDQRSAQLESQLFAMNDLITQAMPAGVPIETKVTTAEPRDLISQLRPGLEDAVFEAVGMSTMGLLSVYVLWRGFRRYIWKRPPAPALRDHSAQLLQLQQSMDVIALEVERISEAQRYTAKLLSEKSGEKVPSGRA